MPLMEAEVAGIYLMKTPKTSWAMSMSEPCCSILAVSITSIIHVMFCAHTTQLERAEGERVVKKEKEKFGR
jgi:hypothetical protein